MVRTIVKIKPSGTMDTSFSVVRRALSRAEVREVDQIAINRFGMTGLMLMENAGRNAAERILSLAPDGDICVLCGKGNNGGDGYVIARHLELAGRDVRILSLVDVAELSGDAAVNQSIAASSQIPITVVTEAASLAATLGQPRVIVDCLLGTGATGAPRPPYAEAIRIANALPSIRFAVDIPSGLDCDTGQPNDPTFVARYTLTFVATKLGFTKSQALPFVGEVDVLPIGIPLQLIKELSIER
jgi:NAD(P)H-hydrate epimerase